MADPHAPSPNANDVDDPLIAALTVHLVARATGSSPEVFQQRRRDARAVGPRHLVLYLLHVGLGWPLERVGRVALRSRSTISHACRQVEDRRDRACFDQDLAALEMLVRQAVALTLELP